MSKYDRTAYITTHNVNYDWMATQQHQLRSLQCSELHPPGSENWMTALPRKRKHLNRERRRAIVLPASARGMSKDWDLLHDAQIQAAAVSCHS